MKSTFMEGRWARGGAGLAIVASGLFAASSWALPPDGGTSRLQAQIAGKVIGIQGTPVALPQPSTDSSAAISQLLAAPITNDSAVRIALLNNPELQSALGKAGMGITDWQDADNLAKRQAQVDITVLSARASKAWVQAVAAEQSARAMREAKETAEATGELARRMVQAGNLSKLKQAQYQALLSDAAIALARAEQTAFAAREQLIQVLGLWGAQTQFRLADSLPALPDAALDLPDVEARVLAARTDLSQLIAEWQIKLKPPAAPGDLWDAMGDTAAVRAAAVKVRSQARLAYFNYRNSYDIARQLQTQVVPLRKFIHEEQTLRYNGMLTSVFEVLADSQLQSQTVGAATQAARDFWLAQAELQALLAGAPLDSLATSSGAVANDAAPASGSAGH
jgi:multidrug efflux system outer membrane protein